MSLTKSIERATGDNSPLRLTWEDDVELDDVTAISLKIWDSSDMSGTLVETLTGEMRGFDPGVWFPILSASWTGSRYAQIVLTRGAEVEPFPYTIRWNQV